MKTIITTLPIYDKLSKQCFERGKHAGGDTPTPIICPRHRLPSFQWLDGTDGAASVTRIELISINPTDNILGATWANTSFATLTTSGLNITSAIWAGGFPVASLSPSTHTALAGEVITIQATLTNLSGAPLPKLTINEGATAYDYILSAGNNTITHTVTDAGPLLMYIKGNSGGGGSFTLTNVSIPYLNGITTYFQSLPATHAITGDVYFQYKGETLNYLLPTGTYYLKITMNTGHVYYSDWFEVDCVYENLITGWANTGLETFTHSGTTILSAINSVGDGYCLSSSFYLRKGESVTIIFNFTLNSGTLPLLYLIKAGWGTSVSSSIAAGINIITLTSGWDGASNIIFYKVGTNYDFQTSEVLVNREYSEDHLILNFHNDCDLGDILYHDGFTQTLWIKSEPMENTYPTEEEGVRNGESQFIRTFARQVKKYLLRTNLMPDYMVDVFNRMKLHDSIQLIDLVGDTHNIYNLEVEHEWLGTDKYYAKLDLIFDYNEAVVIGGCCNNIS